MCHRNKATSCNMKLSLRMRPVLLALGCAISTVCVVVWLPADTHTHHLATARVRLVAATGVDVAEWQRNVADELMYWDQWFKTKGLDCPDTYAELTKSREIGEDIKSVIPDPGGRTVRILDAGAGPLTTLGDRWAGRNMALHACDALAYEFDHMLADYHIVPPVRTIRADFETLSSTFPADHFDMVHVRNALDQSHDPVKCIGEAIAVTRMHGVVYMSHELRKAINSGNKGLHVWNFDLMDGHPVIWNCRRAHNLSELFQDVTRITHTVADGWINVRMLRVA